jgi:chaperonin cofactor prefoldin
MALTPEQQLCKERHERIDARLDEAEKSIKELSSVVGDIKELVVEIKYMREDINNTISRLNKLESKDADKWDKFKWLIVAALVSATIGAVIGYAMR